MTVKELISKLKKMDGNLKVYTADHDHGTYETNALICNAYVVDKSEMTEYDNDNGDNEYDDTFKDTPNKYVVIRP